MCLLIDQPPAVQHRLLHGGDQEAAIGMHDDAEMRALPFELFGFGLRCVGKPQRGAVIVRDGEPETFRQEGEPAHRRRRLEGAKLLRLYEGRFTGRPGDSAIGTNRDMIDPAVLRVGRYGAAFAADVGLDNFAVVAARDDD